MTSPVRRRLNTRFAARLLLPEIHHRAYRIRRRCGAAGFWADRAPICRQFHGKGGWPHGDVAEAVEARLVRLHRLLSAACIHKLDGPAA